MRPTVLTILVLAGSMVGCTDQPSESRALSIVHSSPNETRILGCENPEVVDSYPIGKHGFRYIIRADCILDAEDPEARAQLYAVEFVRSVSGWDHALTEMLSRPEKERLSLPGQPHPNTYRDPLGVTPGDGAWSVLTILVLPVAIAALIFLFTVLSLRIRRKHRLRRAHYGTVSMKRVRTKPGQTKSHWTFNVDGSGGKSD